MNHLMFPPEISTLIISFACQLRDYKNQCIVFGLSVNRKHIYSYYWQEFNVPHVEGDDSGEHPIWFEIKWLSHDNHRHRINGPSDINNDTIEWRCCNIHHRIGGPAYFTMDGEKRWYLHDKIFREDGPSYISSKYYEWGSFRIHNYCLYATYHRIDGPAVMSFDGTHSDKWYQFGERHRTDGPAVLSPNGDYKWYYRGKKHRPCDKPARVAKISKDKWICEWWTHGVLTKSIITRVRPWKYD